jgi:hypothetical protein
VLRTVAIAALKGSGSRIKAVSPAVLHATGYERPR